MININILFYFKLLFYLIVLNPNYDLYTWNFEVFPEIVIVWDQNK